jgi:fatty-acyl-CoA synthase
MQQWQGKGVLLTQAYGLTETGGHVALLFGEDAQGRLGGAGRKLPGVELAIADDDGRFLVAGEEGEILVRGPMIMTGYLNNPEETAKTMLGDWLRTGDIGVIDAAGFLMVTGRKKDMLRSGGLNVYPSELERVLAGICGIEEFAIIGVKDAKWGEVPMIVAHGAVAPDLDALRERCTRELAGYKRPRFLLDYGKPLPRTYSGKIQKQVLRDEFELAPAHATRLSYDA